MELMSQQYNSNYSKIKKFCQFKIINGRKLEAEVEFIAETMREVSEYSNDVFSVYR
jgi:hypothetical protein